MKNTKKLPTDAQKAFENGELEKVSGGYTFGEGAPGLNWEVVDDGNGEVLGRYKTKDEAIEMAYAKGQSPKRIYWHGEDGLWRLRELAK